jgi:hypothetical protein
MTGEPTRYRFPEHRVNPPTALVDEALSAIDFQLARALDWLNPLEDAEVTRGAMPALLEAQRIIDRLRAELRQ